MSYSAANFEQTLSSRSRLSRILWKLFESLKPETILPAFKPGSTSRCRTNRCDDNSLILENSYSTGEEIISRFTSLTFPPSLSRETLGNVPLPGFNYFRAKVLVK